MSNGGAKPNFVSAIFYAAQFLDPIYIEQHFGCRQAHVERGHQALPAGQNLRAAFIFGEQRHGLFDGGWSPINERCRLH